MEREGIPSVASRKVFPHIATALASAVLEWSLLFMLFIDAGFSYLITKFAFHFGLQIPCLLCSRLDHVLGTEKTGFYWDLICGNHKQEISSLVLCRVHNKLIDVRGMCETCLFSFATINKSNAETYRLLAGKLGDDPDDGVDQDPLLRDYSLDTSGMRNCSCCRQQWMSTHYAQKLLRSRSIGVEVAEVDEGMNKLDLKKISDESSVSLRDSVIEKNVLDHLPHIEYKKVKITSDTESETSSSDNDSASALIKETYDPKEDISVQAVQLGPGIINLAGDSTSEKLIHLDSVPEASPLTSSVQKEIMDSHDSAVPVSARGHELEELKWQQADVSVPSERISFNEMPLSSNVAGDPAEALRETLNAAGTGKVEEKIASDGGDICKVGNESITTNEAHLESRHVTSDSISQIPNYLELGEAYKLAIDSKGRYLSGKLSELRDSSRVGEDFKLLLSQLSASRGIELSVNDLSPRVSGNIDESKTSDASSSIGMQILQRRISIERNESGLSLDGSTVSEIEGESVVDRLKRQVEHDKKLMSALYKELEEERNASAVAVNQAMAMITKLQEEKATLHMEALQCLRMMEEQAEYDGEALQNANDLLAEKEKEIKDLEAELELYNEKCKDVAILKNTMEPTSGFKEEVIVEYSDAHCTKGPGVSCNSVGDKPNIFDEIGMASSHGNKNINSSKSTLLEFEDERSYILQCLKKLEKKLCVLLNNSVHDISNSECSTAKRVSTSDLEERNFRGVFQENGRTEENDMENKIGLGVEEEIKALLEDLCQTISKMCARKDASTLEEVESQPRV